MKKQKAIVIIASLLLVGILLSFFFIIFPQTKEVSLKTQTSAMNFQSDVITTAQENDPKMDEVMKRENLNESASIIITPEEETQLEADHNNEKQTITEEIKKKIREVLAGTIRLFKNDLEIVAIGDSLTQGVGDESESGGFVGILDHTFEDNDLKISVENYGKRGNRTDQLLKRLENKDIEASIRKADSVIITIGSNDIMKVVKSNFINLTMEPFQIEREEYIKRLKAIFTKINELNPDAQIYLVGFYNPFERFFSDIKELEIIINDWNNVSMLATEEFEYVHYIPIADLFVGPEIELLADDLFHPNISGYKLIADRVLDNLQEISVEQE